MMLAPRNRHQALEHRRGSALVASLIVVILVAGLGSGLVSMQSAITRRHAQGTDLKRALYVAEAGIAEAFSAIAVGKSGSVGTSEVPAKWGRGVYWVEATTDTEGNVHLMSTGLSGLGRFTVTAVVKPGVNPAAANGVFGSTAVTVGEGAIVDGYDSTKGTYSEQVEPGAPGGATGTGARLTSNGDVLLYGNLVESEAGAVPETFVYGDIRPGVHGVVLTEPGVVISGSSLPIAEKAPSPPIPVPEILTSEGSEALAGTLVDEHLRYDELRVLAGTTLRLQGPLKLVVDSLEVDGRLEIDGSTGAVEVFVLQTFRFRTGSELETINPSPRTVGFFLGAIGEDTGDWDSLSSGDFSLSDSGDSGRLALPKGGLTPAPPTEEPLVFEPTGNFHGLLYAPFVDLTVPASLRFFGAVGARSIELAPGARVSFDEGVASASLGVAVLPELVSWQIVALPDEPLVTSRVDALVQLKVAGVTPLDSSVAHRESRVALKYVDTGNVKRAYLGELSLFNWSNLKTIEGVQWEDPDSGSLSGFIVPAGVKDSDGQGFLSLDPSDA